MAVAFEEQRYTDVRRVTKFDLPLASLRFGYMSMRRQSRFEKLKPNVLIGALKNKPKYDYIRVVALNMWEFNILKSLSIITKKLHLEGEQPTIPHRLYSWAKKDYLERRKVEDYIWIEVLRTTLTKDCEKQKLQFDIEELKSYIKLLISAIKTQDVNLYYNIFPHMKDTTDVLFMHKDIIKELQKNKERLAETVEMNKTGFGRNPNDKTTFMQRIAMQTYVAKLVEHKGVTVHISDPIKSRYQINYSVAKSEQAMVRFRNIEDELRETIAQYNERTEKEDFCSQCTVNRIRTECEMLKDGIDLFTTKFENATHKIDNKISAIRLLMDKLRSRQRFFVEQVQRFHEEIEIVHQQEIARKKAFQAAAERQLQEERALVALNRMKRHGKVKAKGKDKDKGKGRGKGKKK